MKRHACSGSTRSALPVLVVTLALAVAGCGGSAGSTATGSTPSSAAPSATTASATPSATPTVTVSPSVTATPTAAAVVHVAKKGEPPLYAVAGFTYSDVPKGESLASVMAEGMNKSAKGLVTTTSTHMIEAADGEAMMLMEFTIGPKYRDRATALRKALANDVEMWGGAVSRSKTISGEKVSYASSESRLAYGWYHAGSLVFVMGGSVSDPAVAEKDVAAFVTGFLAAAHA